MRLKIFGLEVITDISINVTNNGRRLTKSSVRRIIREAKDSIQPYLLGSEIERIKAVRLQARLFPTTMRSRANDGTWRIGLLDAKNFVEAYWMDGLAPHS